MLFSWIDISNVFSLWEFLYETSKLCLFNCYIQGTVYVCFKHADIIGLLGFRFCAFMTMYVFHQFFRSILGMYACVSCNLGELLQGEVLWSIIVIYYPMSSSYYHLSVRVELMFSLRYGIEPPALVKLEREIEKEENESLSPSMFFASPLPSPSTPPVFFPPDPEPPVISTPSPISPPSPPPDPYPSTPLAPTPPPESTSVSSDSNTPSEPQQTSPTPPSPIRTPVKSMPPSPTNSFAKTNGKKSSGNLLDEIVSTFRSYTVCGFPILDRTGAWIYAHYQKYVFFVAFFRWGKYQRIHHANVQSNSALRSSQKAIIVSETKFSMSGYVLLFPLQTVFLLLLADWKYYSIFIIAVCLVSIDFFGRIWSDFVSKSHCLL